MAFAQDRTISGKIIDESGLPLPGVNVLVKGTSTGAVSDGEGAYTIAGVNNTPFSFLVLWDTIQKS
jgi:TonB-dependent starch-binding outer membrane protein SusC